MKAGHDRRTSSRNHHALVCVATIATLMATSKAVQGETYVPDPVHSQIAFSVDHLGLAKVNGVFTDYSGSIQFIEGDMASLKVDANIQVRSIDTRVDKRDEHLRSPDFFDADKYPEMSYTAKKTKQMNGQWVLVGTLTIHGTSMELELPVTLNGPIEDPWGNQRIGLHASTVINRQDYGVGSDKLVDKAIGDEVSIVIDVEATMEKPKE